MAKKTQKRKVIPVKVLPNTTLMSVLQRRPPELMDERDDAKVYAAMESNRGDFDFAVAIFRGTPVVACCKIGFYDEFEFRFLDSSDDDGIDFYNQFVCYQTSWHHETVDDVLRDFYRIFPDIDFTGELENLDDDDVIELDPSGLLIDDSTLDHPFYDEKNGFSEDDLHNIVVRLPSNLVRA